MPDADPTHPYLHRPEIHYPYRNPTPNYPNIHAPDPKPAPIPNYPEPTYHVAPPPPT